MGVATGYLAIILGYLYLTPAARARIQRHRDWPGTMQLITSVQYFLQICRKIGNKTQELESLVSDLRLQQVAGS